MKRRGGRQIATVKHTSLGNECVLVGITLIAKVNGSFPTINVPFEIQQ
jgi:hypothetical protein